MCGLLLKGNGSTARLKDSVEQRHIHVSGPLAAGKNKTAEGVSPFRSVHLQIEAIGSRARTEIANACFNASAFLDFSPEIRSWACCCEHLAMADDFVGHAVAIGGAGSGSNPPIWHAASDDLFQTCLTG